MDVKTQVMTFSSIYVLRWAICFMQITQFCYITLGKAAIAKRSLGIADDTKDIQNEIAD